MSNTPLAQPLLLRARRPWLIFLNLPLLILMGACSEQVAVSPAPPEIPVVNVIQRDQAITMEMVGQTRGSSDVSIRARVDGFLEGMHFTEGNNVEKGDLLYTIDDVPFESSVVEAQGQLAEAQTVLARSISDLARIEPLADINAVSQMDLDAAVAAKDAATGALQSAKAQVEQAQILKSYCRIYSPINGRIGISEAEVGEYVGGMGSSLLNLVSQVDPIRVRFSIDEKNYLKFARKIIGEKDLDSPQNSNRATDGLNLILADGSMHDHNGRVVTTNAVVDPTTGTFTMEADFPNPDRLILAGQYARIVTNIEVRKGALLVPQRSITELQGGFSLFVVDAQNKVALRSVELGPKINRLQIINSGLQAADKVVLEGGQRLKSGMMITPRPTDFNETASSTSTALED
ncbi:MAG: efflux RND transporter periplasmic adaptor subunit [Oceanicoccus sp.]